MRAKGYGDEVSTKKGVSNILTDQIALTLRNFSISRSPLLIVGLEWLFVTCWNVVCHYVLVQGV